MLLNIIVLCQHQPHRLHKSHAFFPQIALSIRDCVCLYFVYIHKGYRKYLKMCDNISKKKKCLRQKLFHTNIRARRAAFVRNYFSRCYNFHLNGSWLPSLSCSAIFDKTNTDILFRRVNYRYLAVNGVKICSLQSVIVYTVKF